MKPYYRSKRKLSKNKYIYTFSKDMMKELLASHPETVSLFLSSWKKTLLHELGEDASIAHKQLSELDAKFIPMLKDMPTPSVESHSIVKWFRDGVRLNDAGLFQCIDCMNVFFDKILPL